MDFLNKVFDFSKKKRPELKNAAIIQFKVLRLQNVYIKCFARILLILLKNTKTITSIQFHKNDKLESVY